MGLRFLLLMRHAKHNRGRVTEPKPKGSTPLDDVAFHLSEIAEISGGLWQAAASRLSAKESSHTVLKPEGRYETTVAAKRLKDFLSESDEPLMLGGVVSYDDPVKTEAWETARTFCEGFQFSGPSTPAKSKLLGPLTRPKALKKRKRDSSLERGVKGKARGLIAQRGGDAVLFVGHQPAVGWLAGALLGTAVPIAQSEILCIDLEAEGRPVLCWSISPADDDLKELQEKIRSKMALANLLSAFITAGLGVFLAMLADEEKIDALGAQAPLAFGAALCFLLAVVLYLRTMFSYDSLLMPVRFWAESASGSSHRPRWIVARPPSGAHWILFQNMIRIWQWQFIPATFLTLSGLFLLLGSVASYALCFPYARALTLSVPGVALLWIVAVKTKEIARGIRGGWANFWSCRLSAKYRYICGPWLGSED